MEARTLLASTLIPLTAHRDLVYDDTRDLLYITTTAGTVQRYDVAQAKLLTPLTVGTSLLGADVTPDGSALYVAESSLQNGKGVFRRVDLASGAVRNVEYTPDFGEAGAWDVAIGNSGKGIVTTQYSGSGWTPLRALNLGTDTLTARGDRRDVRQNTGLWRGADRSEILLQESNISSGPIHLYHAETDGFSAEKSTNATRTNAIGAVSRDGDLFAISLGGAAVFDRNFNNRRTLVGVDGGMLFDPLRDIFYGVESATDQVVAYDTNTWEVRFRTPVGENVTGGGTFGAGAMSVSDDGKKLFLGTATGVRVIDVPQPTGNAALMHVGGFPGLTKSGVPHAVTVTLRDAAGEPAVNYRGTVRFSSNDLTATLPADYTFTAADRGTKTFNVTLNSAGTRSITVRDLANAALTATQSNITIHSGTPSLLPVTGGRDLIFDDAKDILYVTTSGGTVERFNAATGTLLSPIFVGGQLNGGDVTPDGSALYVADGLRGPTQGFFRKVDLADGSIETLAYDRDFGEGGAWDVSIANNGKAIVTTNYEGSGWVPLRHLDLATDTLVKRNDFAGGRINQSTLLARGADRAAVFLQESNISSGPISIYDAATDRFPKAISTNTFVGRAPGAVSRDSSLMAVRLNGAAIFDRQLRSVTTLPSIVGGMVFDPARDVFYGVNGSSQVVAYETTNWTELYRLNVGETAPAAAALGVGSMAVSDDGKSLFLITNSGVRVIALPQATGQAAGASIVGLSPFVKTGIQRTFTLKMRGPAGEPAVNYRGTVQFSSTDPVAALPANYTFTAADAGSKTFTVTFNTPGTHSLTVRDTANAGLTATQSNILVHAGVAPFVPMEGVRDLIFDDAHDVLYVTTSNGTVERFDVATSSLMAPIQVGMGLNGGDVTPDGSALYVAGASRGPSQGFFHRVDLTDGEVRAVPYDLDFGEGAAYDLAIANNGSALATTNYEGSGWTPLRKLDLATGTFTQMRDVRQNTALARGRDRSAILLQESNISSGPIHIYDAATDSITASANTNTFVGGAGAVSRDGSLMAMRLGGAAIYNKRLQSVHTIAGVDGGMVFDPVRDLFYGVNSTADAIIAYDTRTWVERYRLPVGENVSGGGNLGPGAMAVSDDGKNLFLATSTGIRGYALPQPTGQPSTVQVLGFPQLIKTGRSGQFTVSVLDAVGEPAVHYRGTVRFTSTDPTAVLPADYTFTAADGGTKTFTATFNTAGSHSLRVTDTASAALTAQQTGINVHTGNPAFIPLAAGRDLIFDDANDVLYVTTGDGEVERFDLTTGTLLSPIVVGSPLNGGDITADGAALYVADAAGGGTQGRFRRINLSDGAIRNIPYNTSSLESGAWDVAIANNGKALVTTTFAGSGWTPLREIDLDTDTLTTRTGLSSVRQNTGLARGFDRSKILLQESNISSGPIHIYDAATDSFPEHRDTNSFVGYAPGAVSRDGKLMAVRLGGAAIFDHELNSVRNLPGIDGGMAFDPRRAMFYGINSGTDQLVAYDTVAWNEKFRLPIGQNVSAAVAMGAGATAVSDDGKYLFLLTDTGVRVLSIPQPTGDAGALRISGFPRFTQAGVPGTFTVTVYDHAGEPADNYRGTVRFTSTDPTAALPAQYTFTAADRGTKTFTATFNRSGTHTLTASSPSDATLRSVQENIQIHTGVPDNIPIADRRDMVFDPLRDRLYITTDRGVIERYDVATGTLLEPFRVTETALYGIDITPDASALYVADAVSGVSQGFFHRINLSDGAVRSLPYDRDFGEAGAWDVAIASNGLALVTTQYSGSGWTPLRQINLDTDAYVNRTWQGLTFNEVRQNTQLHRGADRSVIHLAESNTSSGATHLYTAGDNQLTAHREFGIFHGSTIASVSRDGSLVAMEMGADTVILNRSLGTVRTLSQIDGGVFFDPNRDWLYGIRSSTDQIVAFDTKTWTQVLRLAAGENVVGSSPMGTGVMAMSDDGRMLFVSGATGVRAYGIPDKPNMGIAGRHLFYNNSGFDGNKTTADAAIAADKSALLAGQTAGFANYSSYTKGINGLMIDLFNFAGTPSSGDFTFKTGRGGDPSTWILAPQPASVTIRRGAGVDGADRVTITWPDNAIRNTWLQVTVKPNSATGLAAPDVFYVANLPGETGDAATPTRVSAADLVAVRRVLNRTADLASKVDFNRDGRVNVFDLAAVRSSFMRNLPLATLPVPVQPAGTFSDGEGVRATTLLRKAYATPLAPEQP